MCLQIPLCVLMMFAFKIKGESLVIEDGVGFEEAGGVYVLEYNNARGETSLRKIKIVKSQGAVFSAIDLNENVFLTFRKDRVVSLKDASGNDEEFVYVPSAKKKADKVVYNGSICFTGFAAAQKKQLIEAAQNANFQVRKGVTKDLEYLCCGPKAGPSKVQKALDAGIINMDIEQFNELIEAGVIPE